MPSLLALLLSLASSSALFPLLSLVGGKGGDGGDGGGGGGDGGGGGGGGGGGMGITNGFPPRLADPDRQQVLPLTSQPSDPFRKHSESMSDKVQVKQLGLAKQALQQVCGSVVKNGCVPAKSPPNKSTF